MNKKPCLEEENGKHGGGSSQGRCERKTDSERASLLEDLAQNTEAAMRISGVVIGKIVSFDESGSPLVDFSSNIFGKPLSAESLVGITRLDEGREVALMFDGERADKPIVIGMMHEPGQGMELFVDGKRQVINAGKELFLKCGKSSLLLMSDGRIVLRGREIVSEASGNNIIRGATVQLN